MSIDPGKVFRLDGRSALITGGTRGIGRAIAEAYVAAGAAVCVMARKPDELSETAEALTALGGTITTFAGSTGDPEAVEAGVAHCADALGGVDVLVNNAGTNPTFGPVIETESRAVRKVLEVNLEGPLYLAQAAWRAWMQEHGGVIVNVISVGGIRPSLGLGMYNASKAALQQLTRQLALELAPGVRANALAPGLVKTHFARALYEHGEDAIAARLPMRRLGVPDDLAGAALFLASDASTWLTGETLVVDGGALVSGVS
jgi:NAD(P)-dependent dehydrogenase (short-subunit alcohol dehydrogenase family)